MTTELSFGLVLLSMVNICVVVILLFRYGFNEVLLGDIGYFVSSFIGIMFSLIAAFAFFIIAV